MQHEWNSRAALGHRGCGLGSGGAGAALGAQAL